MKWIVKWSYVFLISTLTSQRINACDVCGASVNTVSMGILPNFYKHYIGLYGSYSGFRNKHEQGTTPYSDFFTTVELRGRFHILPRWQVFFALPISNINHQAGNNSYTYTSLSDASIWGAYTVWQKKTSARKKLQHLLQVGGGLKLPTGRFKQLGADYSWNPGAQLGTGSIDGLAISQYTFRFNNLGMMANVSGRMNTRNSWSYRFGSRLSSGINMFYQTSKKKWIILPYTGMQYEYSGCDRHQQDRLYETRSGSFWWSAGSDLYWRTISLGLRYQLPIYQHTNGAINIPRFNANLYINFK